MSTDGTTRWDFFDRNVSTIFVLASVVLLIAAIHRGSAYLLADVAFNDWIGLFGSLVGRLLALLGIAGLSVQVARERPRIGGALRVLISLAIASTLVLISLAVMENLGSESELIAVFGFGTLVLSVLTYLSIGILYVWTEATSRTVGVLMIVASLSLVSVVVGQQFVSVEVVGTIVEGLLFVIYFTIARLLRSPPAPYGGSTDTGRVDI